MKKWWSAAAVLAESAADVAGHDCLCSGVDDSERDYYRRRGCVRYDER